MYYSNSNHNSLLFIVVFIIISSHYVSPSYKVFRQKEDLLTVDKLLCHEYNSLAFFNNTFLGCRCSNGAGIYHAMIKNKIAFCRSSQDLGCYINLRDRKGGDVSSNQVYALDYPDATYKYSLVESYKLQIWNIDADRVEIWSDVTETFWKRYFEITQNGLGVRNLQNIWNGHAIRIIFKFKNKADQCLFIKVPGSIDYPAVIKDIPASKEIQDFITPSANFQSIQQSLPLTTNIVPTSAASELLMSIHSTDIMILRSLVLSSIEPMSSRILISKLVFVSSMTSSAVQAKSSSSYEILQSIASADQSMLTSNQPVPATSKQMIAYSSYNWEISMSRPVFVSSITPMSSEISMSRSVFVPSITPMSSEISMSRSVFVSSITPMWSLIQAKSSSSYQILQSIASADQSMSTSNQPVPATSKQMIAYSSYNWEISMSRPVFVPSITSMSSEISMSRSVFVSSITPMSSEISMSRSVFVSSITPMWSIIQAKSSSSYQILQSIASEDQSMSTSNQPVPATSKQMIAYSSYNWEISMSRPVFVSSITPTWSAIQATSSSSYQNLQSITSEDQSMSTSNQPVPANSMQMIVSSQSSLASTVVQIKTSQSNHGTISFSLDPLKTSSLVSTPEYISSTVSSSPFTPRAQFTVSSAGSIQSSTVLTNTTTVPPADEKTKDNAPMIVGVTISLVGLLVFVVVALYVARKRLKKKRQVQPEDQLTLNEDVQSSSHSVSSAEDEVKKNAFTIDGEQTFHTTSK